MGRKLSTRKLALAFGGGCNIFPDLENTFKDIDFAVLNYWIEGAVMVDMEKPIQSDDHNVVIREVEWLKPNPPSLETRFGGNKYHQSKPVALIESYSEWLQSEFKIKQQSFIDIVNQYEGVYLVAYLDNEMVDGLLVDFILNLNHPNCKLLLLFPPILSGKARVSKANKILESLIDLDIKHHVIFLQDFIDTNQSMYDFSEQCDLFISNILTKLLSEQKISDKEVYRF